MNLIEEYVQFQEEANKIVQGLVKRSGKPEDHVKSIWKETEKEVITKHKFGVSDKYREIGDIVQSKLGLKSEDDK